MSSLRVGFVPNREEKRTKSEIYARISQQTFDETVIDNIEQLDMTPEEALQDAIDQFEKQNVNLSNILKRMPGQDQMADPPVLTLTKKLAQLALGDADLDEAVEELNFGGGTLKLRFRPCADEAAAEVGKVARALRAELVTDGAAKRDEANCALAGHNGAVDALVSAALATLRASKPLVAVLDTLAVLLMDAENRERLDVRGIAAVVVMLRAHAAAPAPLAAAFRVARAAMLNHERYRLLFVGSGGLVKLAVAALVDHPENPSPFLAACGAIRATTLDDDARVKASKGIEHAKSAVTLKALPPLLAAARGPMARDDAHCAELLATLSRLAVTDEICTRLARMDALRLAIDELSNHMTDAKVAKQACFFLSNISGNDECKRAIVAGNGHVAIIQAMHLHPNNGPMQVDAVAALGNMALRMPDNCTAIYEAGGLGAIVSAFTQHLAIIRMQNKGAARRAQPRRPQPRDHPAPRRARRRVAAAHRPPRLRGPTPRPPDGQGGAARPLPLDQA